MVCRSIPDPFLRSSLFVAELREAVGVAIPGIVECLNDSHSRVRTAAVSGLSALAAHGLCHLALPVVALIPFCS